MIEIKPTKPVTTKHLARIVQWCTSSPEPTWRPLVKVEPCAMDMTLLRPKPLVKKAPVAPVAKPQSTERPPAIVRWVEPGAVSGLDPLIPGALEGFERFLGPDWC